MNTYKYTTANGEEQEMVCRIVTVEGGYLIFHDEGVVLALAPGAWLAVERLADE